MDNAKTLIYNWAQLFLFDHPVKFSLKPYMACPFSVAAHFIISALAAKNDHQGSAS